MHHNGSGDCSGSSAIQWQNFRAVVIGVGDRNYKVIGKAPVLTVQRDDLDPSETGWQWCVIWAQTTPFPLQIQMTTIEPSKKFLGACGNSPCHLGKYGM
jgi:hypothetical protein